MVINPTPAPQKPRLRCAIYTRKSSEDGLEQSFNSLDAQYEACEAYITSQRQEGWVKIKACYDDGGLSGGTLERPALKALLADVAAGQVDMIVVYKIDRLTRSLADFAKLVDLLEAKSCSFVSVTQAFNTSSSMGRLTLNVLLSFAQFEREVTAERIRDKIAASKAKGIWMGGPVPLGYSVYRTGTDRGLSINTEEAKIIQTLFDTYEASPSVYQTMQRLKAQGVIGRTAPLNRGQIHGILKNPLYAGWICHKGTQHPGRHEAIISQEQFDRVQALLAARAGAGPEKRSRHAPSAPLKGKLRDSTGDRLTPTWTKKASGQIYRYYVSSRSLRGITEDSQLRINAKALETTCQRAILQHLTEGISAHPAEATDIRAAQLAIERLEAAFAERRGALLRSLILDGLLTPRRLSLTLDVEALAEALGSAIPPSLATLTYPLQLRRTWKETKIILATPFPEPDRPLVKALYKAHLWIAALKAGASVADVAAKHGLTNSDLRKRIYLACLSPKIQRAILAGTFPDTISLTSLATQKLPLSWAEQHALFLHDTAC